ncbi:MAG: family 10 glycosylhydrolase [Rhizobacter sp.]|nr:family 10 glycosylhydrolase [Chlorobiales bacterium]
MTHIRGFTFLTLISVCITAFPDVLFGQPVISTPAPPHELRGVWIATAFGIDWPKSKDTTEQKAALEKIFQDVKRKKCNAVFFQVRIRGDVMFESPYEPYTEVLTGTLGKSPGYDPTLYALALARKYGLEFHAWFNTMILKNKSAMKPSAGVRHLWETHPEWIDARAIALSAAPQPASSPVIEPFLNPAHPAVQRHLITLISDFAARYDVDGIQLDDYLRYPDKNFPDSSEFIAHNPFRLSLADWRRETINQFVAALSDTLAMIKPYLKFGVTPIGVYRRADREPAMESVSDVYQDSRAWTERKKTDYLAPQIYFHTGITTDAERTQRKFNPAFESLAKDWGEHKNGRHLYIGIGTYKPAVKAEWPQQVAIAREAGANGVIFYPYKSIADVEVLFDSLAVPPPMTWKSNQPPQPPVSFNLSRSAAQLTLVWRRPENARAFNLYKQSYSRSRPLVQNIAADSVTIDATTGDVFFLTTVDFFGTESRFSEAITVN